MRAPICTAGEGDAMEPLYFGTEQLTAEDRAYRGSRYAEVRDAIFANPYRRYGVPPASRHGRLTRSRYRACCAAPSAAEYPISFGKQ